MVIKNYQCLAYSDACNVLGAQYSISRNEKNMLEKTITGLKLLQFENLVPYSELMHAVTTRSGGVSPPPFHSLNLGTGTSDTPENIAANYTLLAKALGFDLHTVVTAHQSHGDRIVMIDSLPHQTVPIPHAHALDGYDAFVTKHLGIVLMVRIADCVPVILYDPDQKVVALVHAGWRGTLAGIVRKTAAILIEECNCSTATIRAGIGPAIGPCCFSVQPDVAHLFRSKYGDSGFVTTIAGGPHIDLPSINRRQLLSAGIMPEHIEVAGLCTACNLNLFFSHRGEKGKTGRFVLCAGLRA